MSELPAAIGRYRIDGLLGQGAMGVVYRAWDPEIDRPVAIKLIRADLLETDEREEYRLRFRREAQAAGRCSHANIVALHDVAADGAGNPFLVMEYVEAISLDRLLAQGTRFSVAQAVSIIGQVLDALACAHELGVVHRDIKPANILLLDGQRVKVTDFGISRLLSSDMTQVGAVIGTPSYMSPEQCLGEEAGPASDLFAVASVLYEVLSGHKAFTASGVGQLGIKLTQAEPPPIPGLPPALGAVLARAHAKHPEARYPSAAAMAAALRASVSETAASAAHPAAGASQAETVVLAAGPQPSRSPPGAGGFIEPDTARRIEALLVRAVGPIAAHLLHRALAQSATAEAAVQRLAASIDDAAQRATFVRGATSVLRATSTGLAASGLRTTKGGAPASRIPPEACDRVARDLSQHLGPIASVLVRREAASAVSEDQLRTALAAHIPDESDRRAFIRGG